MLEDILNRSNETVLQEDAIDVLFSDEFEERMDTASPARAFQ
jgi:hypothetical protein